MSNTEIRKQLMDSLHILTQCTRGHLNLNLLFFLVKNLNLLSIKHLYNLPILHNCSLFLCYLLLLLCSPIWKVFKYSSTRPKKKERSSKRLQMRFLHFETGVLTFIWFLHKFPVLLTKTPIFFRIKASLHEHCIARTQALWELKRIRTSRKMAHQENPARKYSGRLR